jgi:hypothetical protein
VSVDYFYARKEQKFVQAQKKTPQSFDYGVYMVARGGIEPPTQGFSTLIDRPRFYCNQKHTA